MVIANAENRIPKPNPSGLLDFTNFKWEFYDKYYLMRSLSIDTADHVCYCPTNDRLYVSRQVTSWQVICVNPHTFTSVATISVNNQPDYIGYCPTNNRLYVCNPLSNNVSVINPITNSVVATISWLSSPLGVHFSVYTWNIYVWNESAWTVSVINPSTNTIVDTISWLSGAGYMVTVWKFLYVSRISWWITKVDLDSNTIVDSISYPTTRLELAYCPSTNEIYLPIQANWVAVIDIETFTEVTVIAWASSASTCIYISGIDRIAVGKSPTVELDIIDPSTKTIVGSVPLQSEWVKYCPSTNRIIACGRASNTLREVSFI